MLKLKLPRPRPPDANNWFLRKDPCAWKDQRQEEKRMTEDKTVRYHPQLDGHEFSKFHDLVMHWEDWPVAVHSAAKCWTQLSNWTVLDFSLTSSSVCGNSPARILKWVAMPLSRGFSQPKDQTQISRIVGGFFTSWATREAKSSKLKGQVL